MAPLWSTSHSQEGSQSSGEAGLSSGAVGTGWFAYSKLDLMYICTINPLPTNDAPMRHDLGELSISLWEFIWGV